MARPQGSGSGESTLGHASTRQSTQSHPPGTTTVREAGRGQSPKPGRLTFMTTERRVYGADEPESLLFALANAAHFQSRADAAWQLGMHDREDVVDGLVAALVRPEENTVVLMQVVASLDRIRDPRSIAALRQVRRLAGIQTRYGELVVDAAEVAARRIEISTNGPREPD